MKSSSRSRNTNPQRSAPHTTVGDKARKIQRLAEMTTALREGTQNYFEVTRLTSLKSLCQDRDVAKPFALYLAGCAQRQMEEASRPGSVEPKDWKHFKTLAVEAIGAMQTGLASPPEAHQARLYQGLLRVQAAQNETARPMGKYTVRIIHSSQLLVIENALQCFVAPEPGYWAYQTARQYTERYDPHVGTGLIRESVPMLEDILQFWQQDSSQAESVSETTDDPYLEMAYAQLDNLRMWYRRFAAKNPVMLYDLQEQLIYAYPYHEFKADMNQRSQAMLEDQYQRAIAESKMVVFVRDNELRRLMSYSFDIEEP